mgnify:FL=1
MEHLATKESTTQFLQELGFVQVGESDFYDSPKSDHFGSIVQVYIYPSMNGYYCVDVDGGYKAPVVNIDPTENDLAKKQFVKFLDENFPGWK